MVRKPKIEKQRLHIKPTPEEILNEAIGLTLRKMRIDKNITNADDIAYHLDMARSTMRGYELGNHLPMDRLIQILEVIGSDLNEYSKEFYRQLKLVQAPGYVFRKDQPKK